MSIKLNLFQDMYYKETKRVKASFIDEYEKTMNELINLPTYSEKILFCSFHSEDIMAIKVEKKGSALPPSKEIKEQVDNLKTVDKPEDYDLYIPSGSYLFTQLPVAPNRNNIMISLINAVEYKEGFFALRMLKEGALEITVQIIQTEKDKAIYIKKE